MKCSKCGAELTDDTNFCSYCGKKVEKEIALHDKINSKEIINISKSDYKNLDEKKSIADSIKDKLIIYWRKLNKIEKIEVISLVLFIVMSLIAFVAGKVFAGIIAIVSIAFTIITILIERDIIKTPKSWIHLVTLALAIFLIIPYILTFSIDNRDEKNLIWADLILGDVVPKPHIQVGEIILDSDSELSVDIYKTKKKNYNNYVVDCKEKGFTIDSEKTDNQFSAFNKSGYKLSVFFDEDEKTMNISVSVLQKYGTLKWSDSEMAKLIPTPKSKVGDVEKDDKSGFSVYIGKTSINEYKEYVRKCSDKGFTVDVSKDEKSFVARNKKSYKLSVEYIGYNRIHIEVSEPEYDVTVEIECVENLIFSKYDVDVYIDDLYEGTIKHGETEKFDVILKKDSYVIKFVNVEDDSVDGNIKFKVSKEGTFKYKIYCTSSKINVKDISKKEKSSDNDKDKEKRDDEEKITKEESQKKISDKKKKLTKDNCPELAAMLSNKAEIDDSYSDFALKYEGRVIEFDGRIDYCTNHGDYKTRFDYLVSAGDYDPDHQIGPTFKFEDVNYFDLNTDIDTVSVGLNVRIQAKVESFDSNSGLFYLKPVKITER